MKWFILTITLIFFTGCDDTAFKCNTQICEEGIIKFKSCRGAYPFIILDENKQTINAKALNESTYF